MPPGSFEVRAVLSMGCIEVSLMRWREEVVLNGHVVRVRNGHLETWGQIAENGVPHVSRNVGGLVKSGLLGESKSDIPNPKSNGASTNCIREYMR